MDRRGVLLGSLGAAVAPAQGQAAIDHHQAWMREWRRLDEEACELAEFPEADGRYSEAVHQKIDQLDELKHRIMNTQPTTAAGTRAQLELVRTIHQNYGCYNDELLEGCLNSAIDFLTRVEG